MMDDCCKFHIRIGLIEGLGLNSSQSTGYWCCFLECVLTIQLDSVGGGAGVLVLPPD